MTKQLYRISKTLSLTLFVLFGWALFATNTAVAQERDWQPQRTWVFVVGTLRWKHRDMFNSFPQKNRRDSQLVDFFRQQGVPAEQIVYLKDEQATSSQVKTSFADFLSKAREGDLLFFYYCGHGYKSDDERTTFFATYDASEEVEGWSTDAIVKDIEKYFKGSRAFLTADCCYSGSLAEEARKTDHRVSYACLTSSSANELSTANWTFTEMLLAGLSGKAFADINADGRITLNEIAEDVSDDMTFAEEQESAFVTTGSFTPSAVLAGAERKSRPEISSRVEVKSQGNWYKARIIDAAGSRFKVHYYGWEDSDDEWVRANQIRDLVIAQCGVGAQVELGWERSACQAEVLQVSHGNGWDESVSDKKIPRTSW